jgi:hypothetical protein
MTRGTIIGALAGAVVLAACADGAGPDGDALTRAEALAVAEGVAVSGESATTRGLNEGSSSPGITSASEPRTITVAHSSTHPCPTAGRIAVDLDAALTYDHSARSFEFDAEGALTHDACAFVHEAVTLTLNGNPNLTMETHAAALDGRPSGPWTSAVGGGFLWSASDGRSGECTVNLTTVTDFTARTRVVQGNVCGHTIDQTITWN